LNNIGNKTIKFLERERIKIKLSEYVKTPKKLERIQVLISIETLELTLVKLKISKELK